MNTRKLYGSLPSTPGVYLMRGARGALLYIGKAANLKRRVISYFQRPQDSRIQRLVSEIRHVDYRTTDTAIEALILEARLIKKHQPPYNVREKDDTSFLYVEIPRTAFPPVLLVRGKDPVHGLRYGPFTSAASIRYALRLLRRIFPFSTHIAAELKKFKRPCFDYQIGLCPGTCVGAIRRTEYVKTVRNLKLFFAGKKQRVVRDLTREMRQASKALDFERAGNIRRQLFALKHIQDIALISDSDISHPGFRPQVSGFRIEGYDISNISGTSAVGSMVVFLNGEPAKGEYRKFRIRTVEGNNDIAMLREVLERRLNNSWPLPNLILVDGGIGQVNIARLVLRKRKLDIPVVGLAKGPERKRNDVVGTIPPGVPLATLVRIRDEAHRFAVRYHRTLRDATGMT